MDRRELTTNAFAMSGFRQILTLTHVMFSAKLIVMPTILEASKVMKRKKCVQSEWINFKQDNGNMIRDAENVNDADECFRLCVLYEACKALNYDTATHRCELRAESTAGSELHSKKIKSWIR